MGTLPRFGTDGWRGRIGFEFTFAQVERAAAATADHFLARGLRAAAVGYDRRFLSERFARRAASALAGRRLQVRLSDADLPTPALSWAVSRQPASFGIMITASHNPPEFNGFKVKEPDGASLEDASARDIETRMAGTELLDGAARPRGEDPAAEPLEGGNPSPGPLAGEPSASAPSVAGSTSVDLATDDFVAPYLAALRERVDLDRIRSRDWTILADSMHGSGGQVLEQLLSGGRARVLTLRGRRDVLFGGHPPEPIPEHLREASGLLSGGQAHVGLATDGDADRLGALDENGEFVGAQILTPLLGLHLYEQGGRGAVAKTFAHTLLLDRLAQELGLPLRVRPIGFKHLAAVMRKEPVLVCGEESGGIGLGGFIPERDGLLCGLRVLEALCVRNTTLARAAADLRRRFGDLHYQRVDLRSEPESGHAAVDALAAALPSKLGGLRIAGTDRLDGLKCLLGQDAWILFRQSGTEPVLRVYAECRGRDRLDPLLADGVQAIAQHLPERPVPARRSTPEGR